MGSDGIKGVRAMKEAGGKVLVQDEESCVVYGIPTTVIDEHFQDKIITLGSMTGEIVNMV